MAGKHENKFRIIMHFLLGASTYKYLEYLETAKSLLDSSVNSPISPTFLAHPGLQTGAIFK